MKQDNLKRQFSSSFETDEGPYKKLKINENIDELCFNNIDFGVSWTRPEYSDYISVTNFDGFRCFVKISKPENNEFKKEKIGRASTEYYNILDEAEEINRCSRANVNATYDISPSENELWVDKYSPKHYMDLISSEEYNVNILLWLRCWDKFVYKRNTVTENIKKNKIEYSNVVTDEAFKIDPKDNRPVKKAILLAGNAGIGKTTLAKVLSGKCGYFIREINASSDRNVEFIKSTLRQTMDQTNLNNASLGLGKSCLIIDEIDGMSAASIKVLVRAMTQPLSGGSSARKNNALDNDPDDDSTEINVERSSKRSKQNNMAVRRPIICICNNLYSPCLKELRPLCYVVKMDSPDNRTLHSRIKEISEREQMKVDGATIDQLLGMANNDIRSVINTLQMMKMSQKSLVNIGVHMYKDVHTNVFDVWRNIFSNKILSNMGLIGLQLNQGGTNELRYRSKTIERICYACGDINLINNGLYENYLMFSKFKDFHFTDVQEASDWFVFNDALTNEISHHQRFELMKYKSILASYFHLSYTSGGVSIATSGQGSTHQLVWPSQHTIYQRHEYFRQILHSFSSKSQSNRIMSWQFNKHAVIQDVLPLVLGIISTNQIKSFNVQLHSAQDKLLLKSIIANMHCLGLEYHQQKSFKDINANFISYQYLLQPPIDELVHIKSNVATSTPDPLNYAFKQLLSKEVQNYRIRYLDQLSTNRPHTVALSEVTDDLTNHKEAMELNEAIVEPKVPPKPEIKETVPVPVIKELSHKNDKITKTRAPSSFFVVKKSQTPSQNKNAIDNVIEDEKKKRVSDILSYTCKFKYHSSSNNAIRRQVLFKDL